MIKILAIGNSFSQDATALIELLSPDILVRNLYIGGCSLERHYNNILEDKKEYAYEQNGCTINNIPYSIKMALLKEEWDYVTVQQVSGLSGIESSYYPYIIHLIDYIKQYSTAKIVLHQTWAYEIESAHPDFSNYNNCQKNMWHSIEKTSKSVSEKLNLPVIECGKTIAKLREFDLFNIEKGGISLCRDGFHMNLAFGRIATASTWIKFFTGKIPEFYNRKDLSEGYKLIKSIL